MTKQAVPIAKPRRSTVSLNVPVRSGLRVSERHYAAIRRLNPDLRLERTARGELIVMSPTGWNTSRQNSKLNYQIQHWNQQFKLGEVLDSNAMSRLPNGATRIPDVSWVRREVWDALTPEQQRKPGPVCPDFVLELTSPSDGDRRDQVRRKMREYIEQGARLGWLIDPDAGEVEIYRPGQPVETLKKPATLSGEDVLPNFLLDLTEILP